jgi:hypothetical protein
VFYLDDRGHIVVQLAIEAGEPKKVSGQKVIKCGRKFLSPYYFGGFFDPEHGLRISGV